MTELAPTVPSVLGGGALAAVIFYLLRHITNLYRQLGAAQSAASDSANDRAQRAEAELAALRLRVADLEQAQLNYAADWARRAAVARQIGRGNPDEFAKWKWIERLIEEAIADGGGPYVS